MAKVEFKPIARVSGRQRAVRSGVCEVRESVHPTTPGRSGAAQGPRWGWGGQRQMTNAWRSRLKGENYPKWRRTRLGFS